MTNRETVRAFIRGNDAETYAAYEGRSFRKKGSIEIHRCILVQLDAEGNVNSVCYWSKHEDRLRHASAQSVIWL